MGFKNRVRAEVNVLFRRAARTVVAQRPRGIAVFLPPAKPGNLRPGDRLLRRGSIVEIETDTETYGFSDFGHHTRARLDGETVIIGGAQAHDGLYFGELIAFHQGCNTEYFSPRLQRSLTTGTVQHLKIDAEQIF